MNRHLSPDEHMAALDATLDAARAAHLDACETCRADLAALRATLSLVAADPVPEPSPLFWNHFASRVRQATAHEQPALPAGSWLRPGRSWLFGGAAAAAVVVAMFVVRPVVVPPQVDVVEVTRVSEYEAIKDQAPWDSVVETTDGLSLDEVHAFVSASADAAPLVEELSTAERAAFVRLVRAEMELNQ